jgi:hypothetical protein
MRDGGLLARVPAGSSEVNSCQTSGINHKFCRLRCGTFMPVIQLPLLGAVDVTPPEHGRGRRVALTPQPLTSLAYLAIVDADPKSGARARGVRTR